MTLRDSIVADALTVFLVADDFAETITYYPHRFFGEEARESRVIRASVEREQIANFGEDAVTNLPVFTVHVANDPVNGIASDEIDTGGDKLAFAPRDGKPVKTYSIIALTTQDEGMLVLQCR